MMKKKKKTKTTNKVRKYKRSTKFDHLKEKDNLTYEDINDLVERLVETNSYKFMFDGFTYDDIAQEIRKKAFLLLDKWNKDKCTGNPIWYFGFSIQNHLRNLRRDNSVKNPNYNPQDKFNTTPLLSLNSDLISKNSAHNVDADFVLMSSEVRERLNENHRHYYDEMIISYSLKGIPTHVRRSISEVMIEVIGEFLPKYKFSFDYEDLGLF